MENWMQELQGEINALEDVNANSATITLHIEGVKDFFTGTVEIFEIPRKITVKAPEPVSVRLIDGSNVLSGDFTCTVDFLQMINVFSPKPDDPVITINGVSKSIADLRPVTAANNWGIDLGDDYITIGGDKWQIVAVQGLKWLNSQPALLQFTLRK